MNNTENANQEALVLTYKNWSCGCTWLCTCTVLYTIQHRTVYIIFSLLI